MMELPEGLSLGLLFGLEDDGDAIERAWGERAGVFRKRWWIFKEPVERYKNRIIIKEMEKRGWRRENKQWVKQSKTNGS